MRGMIGHKGVEYSLAPDPHLGPFSPLTRRQAMHLIKKAGWRPETRNHLFAIPPEDEIHFRSGRKGRLITVTGRGANLAAAAIRPMERLLAPFGRVQIWELHPN